MNRTKDQIDTILLVEDFEDVREMLRVLLEASEYKVLEAANGAEAVDTAINHHPDIILMDLALPDFDGFETIRRIRKIEGFRNTPIIVLTAYNGNVFYEESFRAGGNYFLNKPIDFDELERLLRRISGAKNPKHGRRYPAKRLVGTEKLTAVEPKTRGVPFRQGQQESQT